MAAQAQSVPVPLSLRPGAGFCPMSLSQWQLPAGCTGNRGAGDCPSQPNAFGPVLWGRWGHDPHTSPAVQVPGPIGHADALLLSLQSPHPLGCEHLLPRDVLQVGSCAGGMVLFRFPLVCFKISPASHPFFPSLVCGLSICQLVPKSSQQHSCGFWAAQPWRQRALPRPHKTGHLSPSA